MRRFRLRTRQTPRIARLRLDRQRGGSGGAPLAYLIFAFEHKIIVELAERQTKMNKLELAHILKFAQKQEALNTDKIQSSTHRRNVSKMDDARDGISACVGGRRCGKRAAWRTTKQRVGCNRRRIARRLTGGDGRRGSRRRR